MAHSENLREDETLTSSEIDLPANPVGDLVWEFAQSNLGNSFRGNSTLPYQCTDFVAAALKAAGAQPGDMSVDPYTWGEEIPGPPQWGTWLNGYIIQFANAAFNSPTVWNAPHHTAIILRPPLVCVARPPWPAIAGNPDNWATWLIHQNDGFPYVTQREVYLNSKTSGDFIVYRPVLPPLPHGRLR
jgi:hypothetical protein